MCVLGRNVSCCFYLVKIKIGYSSHCSWLDGYFNLHPLLFTHLWLEYFPIHLELTIHLIWWYLNAWLIILYYYSFFVEWCTSVMVLTLFQLLKCFLKICFYSWHLLQGLSNLKWNCKSFIKRKKYSNWAYHPVLSVDLLMLDSVALFLNCQSVLLKFFFSPFVVESFVLLHFQITLKEWSLVVSTQRFTNCRGRCLFLQFLTCLCFLIE